MKNCLKLNIVKRIIALIGFIAGITLIADLKAQVNDLDFSVEIVKEDISPEKIEIKVTVESTDATFTYLLFDQDPSQGAEAVQYASEIAKTQYSFEITTSGNYHVCVVDSQDNSRCKKIDIK